ncbi:hypothetical protein KTU01_17340 [Kocuria turfanensis]|uniref:Uncharacterized protein n=2 Tax=Kocuria turfanensis TaxID=388357 RepID=A0A512ID55_9MICC|nr:hypothetical protein KTU01_17340 [Kocuria turfanensis]
MDTSANQASRSSGDSHRVSVMGTILRAGAPPPVPHRPRPIMGAMDSLGTWPRPVPADDRDFDVQVMKRLRTAHGEDGAADRPSWGERLGTSMLLVVPLLSALAVVLLWQQWSRSGAAWLLALIAAVLVATALWWTSRLRRAFTAAQGRLGSRLAHVVDHGVGVVRELTLEPLRAQDGAAAEAPEDGGRVRARLELSVTPVRGSRFRTVVEAVYDADAALLLEVGSHGPVRFLRDDPEGTAVIDTRLSEAQVEQVYRGAALN